MAAVPFAPLPSTRDASFKAAAKLLCFEKLKTYATRSRASPVSFLTWVALLPTCTDWVASHLKLKRPVENQVAYFLAFAATSPQTMAR